MSRQGAVCYDRPMTNNDLLTYRTPTEKLVLQLLVLLDAQGDGEKGRVHQLERDAGVTRAVKGLGAAGLVQYTYHSGSSRYLVQLTETALTQISDHLSEGFSVPS